MNDFTTIFARCLTTGESFDETVILKYLKCGYQEEVDYDIVSECWDESDSPYPISYCPHCGRDKFVPLDIYHQLKSSS